MTRAMRVFCRIWLNNDYPALIDWSVRSDQRIESNISSQSYTTVIEDPSKSTTCTANWHAFATNGASKRTLGRRLKRSLVLMSTRHRVIKPVPITIARVTTAKTRPSRTHWHAFPVDTDKERPTGARRARKCDDTLIGDPAGDTDTRSAADRRLPVALRR